MPYNGILIMRAIVHANHKILLGQALIMGDEFSYIRMKFRVLLNFGYG